MDVEQYTYTVEWSDREELFIARVAEFPQLSVGSDSHDMALLALKKWVEAEAETSAEHR